MLIKIATDKTEKELKSGLGSWVSSLKEQLESGNVKDAKQTVSNILTVVRDKKLDKEKVFASIPSDLLSKIKSVIKLGQQKKGAILSQPVLYHGKKFKTIPQFMAYYLKNADISKTSYLPVKVGVFKNFSETSGLLSVSLQFPETDSVRLYRTDDLISKLAYAILPHIRDLDRKAYLRGNQIIFYDGGMLGTDFADYSFAVVLKDIDKKKNIAVFNLYL